MPRPRECSPLEKQALDLVARHLHDISFRITLFRYGYYHRKFFSTLDIIEYFSILLEGHPPLLLLGVAASFFPEYSFHLSPHPEDPVPVIVMTENGPKTLYQVAKEVCRAEKRNLECSKNEDFFEHLIRECCKEPYILDAFQELLDDRKSALFGWVGFMSRVALLFRNEPAILRKINACLINNKKVGILEKPDGPSPLYVDPRYTLATEFVSKEGCKELLDRAEYHRRAWMQKFSEH